jgi:hypothetical protein
MSKSHASNNNKKNHNNQSRNQVSLSFENILLVSIKILYLLLRGNTNHSICCPVDFVDLFISNPDISIDYQSELNKISKGCVLFFFG